MDAALRDRIRATFEDVPEAVAVYVFGSVARDADGPASDVDVAVLFDRTPASTLMGPRLSLEGRLERAIGRPVDLVVLNTASADLVHRVLRDGDLVVDRDRPRRIRFEVARRNEYFDLQPIRDEHRRVARRRGVPHRARL
jgi:predicted nucleotidyltransferase